MTPSSLAAAKLLEFTINAAWKKVIAEKNLKPELDIVLDTDWLDYTYGDHVYDTSKIKALGMKLEHPDFAKGLAETAAWYRRERWLPAI